MKKSRNIIVILLFLLLFPLCVNAQECSSEERQKVYSLINNIKISYTHVGNNVFDISIYNIPEQLYVIDSTDKIHYYSSDNNVSTSNGFSGGTKYTFRIFSVNGDTCIDDMKYTKSIYINKYNKYSEKEICKNEEYKDFKYCDEQYQGYITDKSFESELEKYEQNITDVNQVETEIDNNNLSNNIIFIAIIASLVVMLVIFVVYFAIRRRKRRVRL